MENYLLLQYALVVMPEIDVEEAAFGHLIVLAIALFGLVLGRVVYLFV